jgi:hypothetical protein
MSLIDNYYSIATAPTQKYGEVNLRMLNAGVPEIIGRLPITRPEEYTQRREHSPTLNADVYVVFHKDHTVVAKRLMISDDGRYYNHKERCYSPIPPGDDFSWCPMPIV